MFEPLGVRGNAPRGVGVGDRNRNCGAQGVQLESVLMISSHINSAMMR